MYLLNWWISDFEPHFCQVVTGVCCAHLRSVLCCLISNYGQRQDLQLNMKSVPQKSKVNIAHTVLDFNWPGISLRQLTSECCQ